jgi:hypothetical protein
MDQENINLAKANEAGGAEDTELDSSAPRERELWLDTMADMQLQSDRRYASLSRQVQELKRQQGSGIPDEMKGFLLMLGLYIGVQLLLPLVVEMVSEWRIRRQ